VASGGARLWSKVYRRTIASGAVFQNDRRRSDSDQGEISALENSGRLPAGAYAGSTMYTTLSPCDMCTGACILYKVARVVIGENKTFVGGEEYLKQRGVEVVVFESEECIGMMKKFIEEKPHVW
jgi:cytosine/creatinine deaminase